VKWLHTDKAQWWLLSGIVCFNLLDIIFTLIMIHSGFAVEANPFMLDLIEKSEVAFALIKLSLVSLCVFLLWRLRDYKIARTAAIFCFFTYGCLMAYHLFGIAISL
jgi:hypothetical protein